MRRVALTAVFIAACSLIGCTPEYPKCEKDEHCNTDGHSGVCVNGMCQECGKDADCKDGFVCKDNKCAPKPECVEDGNCQAGFKCKDDRCVPECVSDGDCNGDQRCNAGRCQAPECLSDADCEAGKRCGASGRCVDYLSNDSSDPDACQLQVIRFGFDSYTMSDDGQKTAQTNAACIKSRQLGSVTLSGHCDERGTEEYNLHLGERRANAVKRYMNALGIDAGKLKTVSYGKERPANPGHSEAAYAENRRVEFSDR